MIVISSCGIIRRKLFFSSLVFCVLSPIWDTTERYDLMWLELYPPGANLIYSVLSFVIFFENRFAAVDPFHFCPHHSCSHPLFSLFPLFSSRKRIYTHLSYHTITILMIHRKWSTGTKLSSDVSEIMQWLLRCYPRYAFWSSGSSSSSSGCHAGSLILSSSLR